MSGYNGNYYPVRYWPLTNEYFPEAGAGVIVILSIPGCATLEDTQVYTATTTVALASTVTITDTAIFAAVVSDVSCEINLPLEVETQTEYWKWDDDSDIDWG